MALSNVHSDASSDKSRSTSITTNGAAKPRDPHAMWWVEHQRLYVDHENDHLIRGADLEDEEDERQYKRLCELEKLLLETEVATFEGAHVQVKALRWAIEHSLDEIMVNEAIRILNSFIGHIERALERHGLKEQVLRWFWEQNVPSAPCWRDHPGKPADAEEIWRTAMRLNDREGEEPGP